MLQKTNIFKIINLSKYIFVSSIALGFCYIIFISNYKQKILIYSGPGVGKYSLEQTVNFLQKYSAKYKLQTVDYDFLAHEQWEGNTALLVIPGGADTPYTKYLNGKINNRIKKYVKNGGKYLGICAGAYFASSYIEFAKGIPNLEIIGKRELSLFPGTTIGPVYNNFSYTNYRGASSPSIIWINNDKFHKEDFFTYYNGGGYFLNPQKYPNIKTLALYKDIKYAAIIYGKYGSGSFILSGVHFEISFNSLNSKFKNLRKIKSSMIPYENRRKKFAYHILDLLLIE